MPRASDLIADYQRKIQRGENATNADIETLKTAVKQLEGQQMYGHTSSKFSGVLPATTATTSTSVIGSSQMVPRSDHQHGIGTHTHAGSTTGGTITSASVSDFNEAVDDRVDALIVDGEGIDTTYDDVVGTLTIAGEDASTTNKGMASFATADFDVSSGAVSLENTVVKSILTDSGTCTPTLHYFYLLGGEGIDTQASEEGIDIICEDATTSNKGIASFDNNDFTVTSGAVSIKDGGIDHTGLSNLNSTTYTHLTAANHTDLTDGGDTTLHVHNIYVPLQPAAAITINDSGGDFDFIIEGDTIANLSVHDAGADVVSIGTTAVARSVNDGTLQVTNVAATQPSMSVYNNTQGYGLFVYNTAAAGTTSGGNIQGRGAFIPDAAGRRLTIYGGGAITTGTTYFAGANISAFSAEAWSSTAGGTYLSFLTASNTTLTRTESLRLGDGAKIGFLGAAPVARHAHIADATGAADVITTCNHILSVLEEYGLLALA